MFFELNQIEVPHSAADQLLCFSRLDDASAAMLSRVSPLLRRKITRLTLEITGFLATHSPSKMLFVEISNGRISVELARCLARHRGNLFLTGFCKALDPESARALAAHRGTLIFDDLAALSPGVAASISATPGRLEFQCFNTLLKPEIAAQLAKHRGQLVLWLKSINAKIAGTLAQHSGGLAVLELSRISPSAAAGLARHRHSLAVGVRNMSEAVARALASHPGGRLEIGGLLTFSPGVARELAAYAGTLGFANLQAFPEPAVAELCRHRGDLELLYFKHLSAAIVRRLAQKPGGLRFYDMPVSAGCCEALAAHPGKLQLGRRNHLTVAGAAALIRHPGPIEVIKPQAMAPQVRAILEQHHAIKFS